MNKEQLFKKVKITTEENYNKVLNINFTTIDVNHPAELIPTCKYGYDTNFFNPTSISRIIPTQEFDLEKEKALLRKILQTPKELQREYDEEYNVKRYKGI